MYFVEKLRLREFTNYQELDIDLHPRFTILAGKNGMGKTNLLDALHYLCLCKSHFNKSDSFAIRQGSDFFRIEAQLQTGGRLACSYSKKRKKQMTWEGQNYERLSDHVGKIPLVFIAPDDLQLLYEGSERRRQYMDFILVQSKKGYIQKLSLYNKLLKQRNAFLRQQGDRPIEHALLDVYDAQLIEPGKFIYEARQELLRALLPLFQEAYKQISAGREQADWLYRAGIASGDWAEELRASRGDDWRRGRSLVGPHRDDLRLRLDKGSLKQYASQGQRKSYLLAMRLAQFLFLQKELGQSPILLLDDIFDKLDAERVGLLLELLGKPPFEQVLISDTMPGRLSAMLRERGLAYRAWRIEEGQAFAEEE